ncbi:hypothetical protein SAY86_017285 [Trapa natans]|uniref:Senescence regulator n=1 Tax=Trapa natans TaxID=22666 RepID=A0AAN7M4Y4_TRANT|nr:hypothetical protein SAY86_017285 [Trapa natans]
MAAHFSSKKKKNTNPFYRFLDGSSDDRDHHSSDDYLFNLELEESDVVWSHNVASPSSSRSRAVILPAFASSRKKKPLKDVAMAASLPVNVSSWSRARRIRGSDEEGDEEGSEWLPPHEYLARRRGESLSVEEGMGKTLKGMELCRFRNKILKKLVGFED